jgi:hypothetical protein
LNAKKQHNPMPRNVFPGKSSLITQEFNQGNEITWIHLFSQTMLFNNLDFFNISDVFGGRNTL